MRPAVTFFSFLMLWAGVALAQPSEHATLTGIVHHAEDGEPLPGVHVFIASSMIGTTTDAEGLFRLNRVPLGTHRLVVSMIGFTTTTRDLFLEEARSYDYEFGLQQHVYELGKILVEGERDPRWQRRLKRFIRLFIGETPYAEETEILNPLVLDFDYKEGRFLAWASEPLIIENRALGYRIHYLLTDFYQEGDLVRYKGEPLFEELAPENMEQAAAWEEKRREAFNGSLRHLLLSMWNGVAVFEGYTLFKMWKPAHSDRYKPKGEVKSKELLKETRSVYARELAFPEKIEIVRVFYKGELEDTAYLKWRNKPWAEARMQQSDLKVESTPVVFDFKGDLIDPYSVTLSGYMAFARIADSLPKEYRPSNWPP